MQAPHLTRALLLQSQGRTEMAIEEFRQHLLEFPEHVTGHVHLSLSLSELKKFDEALTHAGKAISVDPENSAGHFALAYALDGKNDKSALKAIDEALRLDPVDPDTYALRSQIYFKRKNWKQSLADADAGLATDPEHRGCLNYRAQALVMLNQRAAAADTLGQALARNPDDSLTHANSGWAALERGQPKVAMDHFREALRLDADNEWARRGIVEAMKAKSIVYRVFLKWLFMMAKLPVRLQLALVIGGLVAVNAVSQIGETWPNVEPYARVVVYVYLAFALLTWVADLAFDLLLQLSRFGRLALLDSQRRDALLFGAAVLCAIPAASASLMSTNPAITEFGLIHSLLWLAVAAAMIKSRSRRRGILVVIAGFAWAAIAVFVASQIELVNGVPMISLTAASLRKWLTPLLLAIQFLHASTSKD